MAHRFKLLLFLLVSGLSLSAQVTAVNDIVSTNEDVPKVVDVQVNDMGPAACTYLSTTILIPGQHGSSMVLSGDSIRYVPDADYYGNDTVTYRLCDCFLPIPTCDTAKIIFNVLPVNDPPNARNDYDTTNEDVSVVIDVQHNDTDPDGGYLVTVAAGSGPYHGTAIILGTDSVRYVPDPNFYGLDSFKYQICDDGLGSPSGSLCDTAWVFIRVLPVNDTPFFSNMIHTISVNEDDTVVYP